MKIVDLTKATTKAVSDRLNLDGILERLGGKKLTVFGFMVGTQAAHITDWSIGAWIACSCYCLAQGIADGLSGGATSHSTKEAKK